MKPGTSPNTCMREEALPVSPLKESLVPCILKLCSAVSSGSTWVSLSITNKGSIRPWVSSAKAFKASTDASNCSRCRTAGAAFLEISS